VGDRLPTVNSLQKCEDSTDCPFCRDNIDCLCDSDCKSATDERPWINRVSADSKLECDDDPEVLNSDCDSEAMEWLTDESDVDSFAEGQRMNRNQHLMNWLRDYKTMPLPNLVTVANGQPADVNSTMMAVKATPNN